MNGWSRQTSRLDQAGVRSRSSRVNRAASRLIAGAGSSMTSPCEGRMSSGARSRMSRADRHVAPTPSTPLYVHWVAASDQTLPGAAIRSPVKATRSPRDMREEADGTDRMARRRQHLDLEGAEPDSSVLGEDTGDLDRPERAPFVLANAVVVVETAGLPVVLGVAEQVLLDRRDPHIRTVGERQIESLDLVPVVVRHRGRR